MNSTIFAIGLGLLGASISTAAAAAPADNGKEAVLVQYGDLNLQSAADQHRFGERIQYGAYQLCLVGEAASPSPMFDDPACYRASVEQGTKTMNQIIDKAIGGKVMAMTRPAPSSAR